MNNFDRITKRVSNPLTWFLALLMAALVTGCGGGGGGTTAAVSTTGTSTGTVTAFGSVYVNGVKYDTTGIPIRVNGVTGIQTDLSVGDVVTVTGTSNGTTGVATSIEYWADVEGPISAVNAPGNTLTVFGQAVIVNNATVFDGATTGLTGLTPLLVNNMVEVSGFRDGNGAIVASRIEKKTANFVAGAAVEVKGTVSNSTTTTFMIGTLTVNHTNSPALANGMMVEVKGTAQLAAGPLTATLVEIEDNVTASSGNRGEIEGYITNFVSASNFKVGGQTVNAANATFEHGTAANLADGAKVEVEGAMSGGVLMASKVEVEQSSSSITANIKVEAPVEAITATTITLLGQTFTYDAQTQMEDETSTVSLNSGNIATRITTSNYAAVRGYKDSTGKLIATRIEVEATPNPLKVEVQGALEAGAATSELKILGLRITTSGATFKAANDTTITATTFFATAIGTVVEVEGTKSGTGSAAVIAATEVEIESDGVPAAAKAVTVYSLAGVAGMINEQAKTIAVTVPSGTNVTALVATFAATGASVKVGTTTQINGSTANSFANPVSYIVTDGNGGTVTYIVTVTVASATAATVTAYSLAGVAGTINEQAKSIAVIVPNGTNVTALVATFAATGASVKVGNPAVTQVSGSTANNFTSPVAYTVTAANTTTTAIYTVTVAAATGGAAPVNLGAANNFVILAKSAISTTGTTAITGNIGVSPAAASFITGFGLIADATNVFSTSAKVTGQIFAADYAVPTPSNLTTAVLNMQTAYTDAAGRAPTVPAELGAGSIGGMTLAPGVYKWGTGVSINSNVTLSGSATDVWIFQIAQGITQASATRVILTGGALAKNVFWQSFGVVEIGTGAHMEGVVLSQTAINLRTGATANGRLLAQTAVTLDAATVTQPAP